MTHPATPGRWIKNCHPVIPSTRSSRNRRPPLATTRRAPPNGPSPLPPHCSAHPDGIEGRWRRRLRCSFWPRPRRRSRGPGDALVPRGGRPAGTTSTHAVEVPLSSHMDPPHAQSLPFPLVPRHCTCACPLDPPGPRRPGPSSVPFCLRRASSPSWLM